MPQSESIDKLMTALAAAQKEFKIIPKSKTGRDGNREFLYADLADVLKEITPKLNAQGIFLSHPLVLESDGHLRVTTRVDLGSEFKQSDGIRLSATEGAGKILGIENTYARRIDNNNFFGIFPDDDLDAPDLKSGDTNKLPTKPAPQKPSQGKPTPALNEAINSVPQSGVPIVTNGVFSATNTDLPKEIFEEGSVSNKEPVLSSEDAELADSLGPVHGFVPLSEKRNTEIQSQLRDWIKDKTLPTRNLSIYLDKVHEGKKQFDVSATQWEDTFAKIKKAVEGGPDAVKTFFKENKG